ncbi:MAG TPA: homoserine dehydrogenase [Candidatus Eisenbacteria bacterium]|nr:homoserine dehydrogenase [Candidatus Eisenbacteria bacterium]
MPSTPVRVGLLGCGVVGSGLLGLLGARERAVAEAAGGPVRVTRIAVREPGKRRDLDLGSIVLGSDPLDVANADDVDVIVEVMGGLDAAYPAVRRALERALPVITANKHLISVHGPELESLAAKHGAVLRHEASVAGVIPVLQSLDQGLRTERFTLLVGILNGTTNFILSTMEREGRDFSEALDAARTLGFAEADPSLDLSGADTAQKLTLLARKAFRTDVPHGSIPTEGIVGMELEDLRQAERFGYVVKLLGIGQRTTEGLDLRVHPAFIPRRYLLASVRDEFNGVYLRGEASGSMLLYGKGAGALPTAQAVLGDLIAVARERRLRGGGPPGPRPAPAAPDPEAKLSLDEVRTKYYVRLLVDDQPGVLAQIAQRLGGARVSVAQMFQEPGARGESSITLLTHEARDRDVRDAIAAIGTLATVRRSPRAIRIFDR